jgi:hypothetical protein
VEHHTDLRHHLIIIKITAVAATEEVEEEDMEDQIVHMLPQEVELAILQVK